jgi:hypothetical protein
MQDGDPEEEPHPISEHQQEHCNYEHDEEHRLENEIMRSTLTTVRPRMINMRRIDKSTVRMEVSKANTRKKVIIGSTRTKITMKLRR